jgi:hypothetical protein
MRKSGKEVATVESQLHATSQWRWHAITGMRQAKRKKTEVACKKKVVTIIFACHLPWEVGLEVCIS